MRTTLLNLQAGEAGADWAEIVKGHSQTDRLLLKLFQGACLADKSARAYSLCRLLHLEKSLAIAVKLADKHNLTMLADRILQLEEVSN